MQLDLQRVKLYQAKACLSVNEIVNKTGLGRKVVSQIINGRVKGTPKTIGLIAKALNVDVSEIILKSKLIEEEMC